MDKFIKQISLSFAVIFLIFTNNNAQCDYISLINPVIQFNGLYDIDFRGHIGVAVGYGGSIIRSIDNGKNWTPIKNKYKETFTCVSFIDSSNVIAGTSSGSYFLSNNRGISWSRSIIHNVKEINDIFFLNNQKGFLVADSGLYNTNDGGNSWKLKGWIKTGFTRQYFKGLYFFNDTVGIAYLVGSPTIIKTLDGGITWQQAKGIPLSLMDIQFVNKNLAFAYTNYGELYKSIDQGETWIKVPTPRIKVGAIYFKNENEGFLITQSNGEIYKTSDGGKIWKLINKGSDFPYNHLFISKVVAMGNYWIATSNYHKEIMIYDGGKNQWYSNINKFCQGELRALKILNENEWVFIGNDGVFKTPDRGQTFELLYEESNLRDLQLLNEKEWFVVGNNNIFRKTNDGGQTWINNDFPGSTFPSHSLSQVEKVFFKNKFQGFVLKREQLLKTTDGGTSWVSLSPLVEDYFSHFHYFNDSTFYIKGNNLYKTTNGGKSWAQFPNRKIIHFFDKDNGIGVSMEHNGLYRTTDGAESWTQINLEKLYWWGFDRIFFIDAKKGFIISFFGKVLTTDDGGETWNEISEEYGLRFTSICRVDNTSFAFVGDKSIIGIISNCEGPTNGIEVGITENDFIIYPNPSQGRFKVTLEKEGTYRVNVFNNFGMNIISNKIFGKNILIDLGEIKKGIYFIEIIQQEKRIIKKVFVE